MAESMVALIGLSLFRVAFARLAFWPPASCSMATDAVCLSALSRAVTAAFVGMDAFGSVATEWVAGGGVTAVTGWAVVDGVAAVAGWSVVGGIAAVESFSAVVVGVETGTDVSALAGEFGASATEGA